MGATRSGIESRTRELVPLEPELPQVRQRADLRGHRPRKRVFFQLEVLFHIAELPKLRRYSFG